ncbi:MAG: AAA family ATPase, partial [Lachnospiraceae bacterium]|nr:AAA family ATPase [Lachnospiraceae bacterium]
MIRQEEQQYLDHVLSIVQKNQQRLAEKMGTNAQDMAGMNDYFWENYTEFDEYGYEMYDHSQAMKVGMTQQEEYEKERKRLHKMQDNPYFGRVDFCYEGEEEPETYYIGIGNLAGERAETPVVYDWRAPVSGLFYDFDRGPGHFIAPMGTMEGEITRKRQFKIRDGKLIYALESDMNIDDEILQKTLSEHTDAKLKSIVTTIQREQNRIIRDMSHKILVVQGCAGSGKTSIALHRIAYLLYHQRDKLKAAQVLVLSPNSIFGDYISRILPELGEENVCEMTLDDYAYKLLSEYGEAEDRYDEIERSLKGEWSEEIRYRKTKDFVSELDGFVLELEWDIVNIRDFTYDRITLDANRISKLFYEQFADVPILGRMDRISEYLIDEVETLRGKDMEEEDRLAVMEKMNNMYETRELPELYQRFLKKTGRPPMELRKGFIPYEDVYPMLYLKYAVCEMPKNLRVKHLIIDEMQDYSYLQYRLIQKMFRCSMTILGDRMQTMSEEQQDVLKFLPGIFGKEVFCVEMKKSYRSTTEIMKFASRYLGGSVPQDQECVERHGDLPVFRKAENAEEMWKLLAEDLRNVEAHTAAVLCLDQERANRTAANLELLGVEVH